MSRCNSSCCPDPTVYLRLKSSCTTAIANQGKQWSQEDCKEPTRGLINGGGGWQIVEAIDVTHEFWDQGVRTLFEIGIAQICPQGVAKSARKRLDFNIFWRRTNTGPSGPASLRQHGCRQSLHPSRVNTGPSGPASLRRPSRCYPCHLCPLTPGLRARHH